MIVKVTANRRPLYLLVSSKGKIIGKHRTVAEAKSQERAIQIRLRQQPAPRAQGRRA